MSHPANDWTRSMIYAADRRGWVVVEAINSPEPRITLEDRNGTRITITGVHGLYFEHYLEQLTAIAPDPLVGAT